MLASRGSSAKATGSSQARAGAWRINIHAPADVTRSLLSVLSSITIPELNLPPLNVSVSDDGLAEGTIDGKTEWTMTLPRRGWLGPILSYTVATATSLLREFHFVHAGAVGINGRGYVLVGPSGAGKTTAVAVLLRRGATYLSDEVALLHPKTGTVHPFILPMAVKPWTAKAIGPLPPTRLVASDARIQYLLPERLAQEPVPLDSLVLLDPTRPPTEIEEYPRAEMLLAISENPSSFHYRHRLEASFSAFVQLIKQTRCLRVGSANPAQAVNVLLSR